MASLRQWIIFCRHPLLASLRPGWTLCTQRVLGCRRLSNGQRGKRFVACIDNIVAACVKEIGDTVRSLTLSWLPRRTLQVSACDV